MEYLCYIQLISTYRLKHCHTINKAQGNEAEMTNIHKAKPSDILESRSSALLLYGTKQGNTLTVIENFLCKFAHHNETSQFFSRTSLIISVSQCFLLFTAV